MLIRTTPQYHEIEVKRPTKMRIHKNRSVIGMFMLIGRPDRKVLSSIRILTGIDSLVIYMLKIILLSIRNMFLKEGMSLLQSMKGKSRLLKLFFQN